VPIASPRKMQLYPEPSDGIQKQDRLSVYFTGRQPPLLYSVLYGIISNRRSVLAAQLCSSKKNQVPSLPGGSLIFIWWKLKMSYYTDYPNWDCSVVVFHLFLYSFICAPTTAFTCLCQTFVHYNSLVFLPIVGTLLVQGFIFERGLTIFKIY
jgi:hypothetical protein